MNQDPQRKPMFRVPDVSIGGPAGQDASPAVARIVGTAPIRFGGTGRLAATPDDDQPKPPDRPKRKRWTWFAIGSTVGAIQNAEWAWEKLGQIGKLIRELILDLFARVPREQHRA